MGENSGFLEMCTKQPTKRETCDQHPIKSGCVPCYMRCGYEYVQSCVCMGWRAVILVCVYVCMHGFEYSYTGMCLCVHEFEYSNTGMCLCVCAWV